MIILKTLDPAVQHIFHFVVTDLLDAAMFVQAVVAMLFSIMITNKVQGSLPADLLSS